MRNNRIDWALWNRWVAKNESNLKQKSTKQAKITLQTNKKMLANNENKSRFVSSIGSQKSRTAVENDKLKRIG